MSLFSNLILNYPTVPKYEDLPEAEVVDINDVVDTNTGSNDGWFYQSPGTGTQTSDTNNYGTGANEWFYQAPAETETTSGYESTSTSKPNKQTVEPSVVETPVVEPAVEKKTTPSPEITPQQTNNNLFNSMLANTAASENQSLPKVPAGQFDPLDRMGQMTYGIQQSMNNKDQEMSTTTSKQTPESSIYSWNWNKAPVLPGANAIRNSQNAVRNSRNLVRGFIGALRPDNSGSNMPVLPGAEAIRSSQNSARNITNLLRPDNSGSNMPVLPGANYLQNNLINPPGNLISPSPSYAPFNSNDQKAEQLSMRNKVSAPESSTFPNRLEGARYRDDYPRFEGDRSPNAAEKFYNNRQYNTASYKTGSTDNYVSSAPLRQETPEKNLQWSSPFDDDGLSWAESNRSQPIGYDPGLLTTYRNDIQSLIENGSSLDEAAAEAQRNMAERSGRDFYSFGLHSYPAPIKGAEDPYELMTRLSQDYAAQEKEKLDQNRFLYNDAVKRYLADKKMSASDAISEAQKIVLEPNEQASKEVYDNMTLQAIMNNGVPRNEPSYRSVSQTIAPYSSDSFVPKTTGNPELDAIIEKADPMTFGVQHSMETYDTNYEKALETAHGLGLSGELAEEFARKTAMETGIYDNSKSDSSSGAKTSTALDGLIGWTDSNGKNIYHPGYNENTGDQQLKRDIATGKTSYQQVYKDYYDKHFSSLYFKNIEGGMNETEAKANADDRAKRLSFQRIYDLGYRTDPSNRDSFQAYLDDSLADFVTKMQSAMGGSLNGYYDNDAAPADRFINMLSGGIEGRNDRLMDELMTSGINAPGYYEVDENGTKRTLPNQALDAALSGQLTTEEIFRLYDRGMNFHDPNNGLVIPEEIANFIASNSSHSQQQNYLNYGKNKGNAESIDTTQEEMAKAFDTFINANPSLKELLDKGLITRDQILLNFFKSPNFPKEASEEEKESLTEKYKSYGSGGYSRSYSRSGGGGGGGGGGGRSSGGYSSSGSSSASTKNQEETRIHNIMKNWTF